MRLSKQQPFVEAAQAGELARYRARLHSVLLQVLQEAGDLRLPGGERQRMGAFEIFGKQGEVPLVGLAGQRPQAFFDPQIGKVLAGDAVAAIGMAGDRHRLDYPLAPALPEKWAGIGIKRDSRRGG